MAGIGSRGSRGFLLVLVDRREARTIREVGRVGRASVEGGSGRFRSSSEVIVCRILDRRTTVAVEGTKVLIVTHLVITLIIVGTVGDDAGRIARGRDFVGETREVIRVNEDALEDELG